MLVCLVNGWITPEATWKVNKHDKAWGVNDWNTLQAKWKTISKNNDMEIELGRVISSSIWTPLLRDLGYRAYLGR